MDTTTYKEITQESEGNTNAAVLAMRTTPFTRLPQGSKASSDAGDTGTIVGVSIVIVILVVVVVVVGVLLRRRKRGHVEPNKDLDRPVNGRESSTSTTWYEMETTSNRSSGISNTIDYCVEDVEIEMQPEGRFPGLGISMFDDKDSLDEALDPATLNKTESISENDDQSDISDIYDVPQHHSPAAERNKPDKLVPGKVKQTDDKSTVISDNNANSFKIKESIKDKTDVSVSETLRRDVDQSEVAPAKPIASGYELAKVITEESTNQEAKPYTKVSGPAEEATSDLEQDDVYENVLIDQDDIYVNHASVETILASEDENNKSTQTLTDTETTQTSKGQIDSSLEPKPAERRSLKAPVPQPRMSIRKSSSTADTANVNKDDYTLPPANDENETATVNPCPVDKDDFEDHVHLDYDSVDLIYDVPKNNIVIDDD